MRSVVVLALAIVTFGCGGGLTAKQAETVINANSSIRPNSDAVRVEAISQEAGRNEAIVRATIGGSTLNFKLRKYDTGWQWEFVETQGGTWIAPNIAIAEVREKNRQPRVAAWARQNSDAYAKTLEVLDDYSDNLPFLPAKPFTVVEWLNERHFEAKILGDMYVGLTREVTAGKHPFVVADQKAALAAGMARVAALGDDSAKDAWGNEILLNFNGDERSAVFLSPGPDKVKNTDDDVICVAKGEKTWDEGERWVYRKTWRLPEGLDSVVQPYLTEKKRGSVEYAKLIKP